MMNAFLVLKNRSNIQLYICIIIFTLNWVFKLKKYNIEKLYYVAVNNE